MKFWMKGTLALALAAMPLGARAAETTITPDLTGFAFLAVSSCGNVDFSGAATAGKFRPGTVDASGYLCTKALSSATGGAAYGPTAEGVAPTQPPIYTGYKDGAGQTRGASPSTQLPTHDYDLRVVSQSLSTALGSYIDIPVNGQSVVGLRFTGLSGSGATITYFSSNDATQTPVSPINSLNASTGAPSGTRATDGETRISVSGRTTLRLFVTTGGSGTITVSYNISRAGNIVDLASPLPPGNNVIGGVTQSGGPWSVIDPNNASYGTTGATAGTTITPGSGTAATAGRVMHYWCPPSTTAGLAQTTYTTANGDTDNITLQPGSFGDVPAAVTYVAALTTVSGTVAGCTFKNHN